MRKYLSNNNGFYETDNRQSNCWINIECPDADDLHFITDELHVPQDFMDSISDDDENPRIDLQDDWTLTLLRIPVQSDSPTAPFITVPFGIITNNSVILTVCDHNNEVVNELIERSRRKQPATNNEVNFILHFFYSAAFFYLKYLKTIYHNVSAANIKLEKSVHNEDLLHIMALQRSLVYFGTSLKGNQMVIHRIKSAYAENFDSFLLEDVEIELRQADNTVGIYSNILAGMLDTFASVISNNVNAVMKRMTGLSIILMVPAIVGGFYGMNVEISYGNHPWVFWVIVAGSFFLSSLAWFIFRRLKWI